MSSLKSKKAAVFCFISGICLLTIGIFTFQESATIHEPLNSRQSWYLITGIALSVSGVVQFMREETI